AAGNVGDVLDLLVGVGLGLIDGVVHAVLQLADVGRIVVVGAIGHVGDLALAATAAHRHLTGRVAGAGLAIGTGIAGLRTDAGHRTGTQRNTVACAGIGSVADRYAARTGCAGLWADRQCFGTGGRGCGSRGVDRQVRAATAAADALVEHPQRAVHCRERSGDVAVVVAG